ncbi:ABC transporter permease subunit [Pseudonocardia nematodicida]|uniref:ABC transporter permease subunit n=1 Tax=Pseudonocardia nematodicida TaxID=1206997 RepID=A0ABV1K6R0_9PSEU
MRTVWILRVLALLFLLLVWELIARTGVIAASVFPPATEVLLAVGDVVGHRSFALDVSASLYEIAVGTAIAVLVGVPLGSAMGAGDYVYRLLDPLLYYFGAVPKIVLLPIFVLFLGTGIESKVGIAAISAAFPIAVSTAVAVREIRPIYLSAARVLGASRMQVYRFVHLPALLGPLLGGVRLGLGVAITAALLAETKVADMGLGYRAIEYYGRLDTAQMYALLLIVFAAAAVVSLGLSALIRRATHFQQQTTTAGTSVA